MHPIGEIVQIRDYYSGISHFTRSGAGALQTSSTGANPNIVRYQILRHLLEIEISIGVFDAFPNNINGIIHYENKSFISGGGQCPSKAKAILDNISAIIGFVT